MLVPSANWQRTTVGVSWLSQESVLNVDGHHDSILKLAKIKKHARQHSCNYAAEAGLKRQSLSGCIHANSLATNRLQGSQTAFPWGLLPFPAAEMYFFGCGAFSGAKLGFLCCKFFRVSDGFFLPPTVFFCCCISVENVFFSAANLFFAAAKCFFLLRWIFPTGNRYFVACVFPYCRNILSCLKNSFYCC